MSCDHPEGRQLAPSPVTTAVALSVSGGGPIPYQVADIDGNNSVSVNDLFAFLAL